MAGTRFEMCHVPLLVLACIFAFMDIAIARCVTSKYEDGEATLMSKENTVFLSALRGVSHI